MFYADDAAFNGSSQRSAHLLKRLMKRGPDQGYFTELAKSLFISDILGQEETPKREFTMEGLDLNFVSGSRYLGAYLGPQDHLEAWVKPKVEAGVHRVSFRLNRPTASPVGLYWLGNVVATRVAVPAKDCPRSWHSNGSY